MTGRLEGRPHSRAQIAESHPCLTLAVWCDFCDTLGARVLFTKVACWCSYWLQLTDFHQLILISVGWRLSGLPEKSCGSADKAMQAHGLSFLST